jgi:hypothetical protein
MVLYGVLQYPMKKHWIFTRGFRTVFFRDLEHCVLDDIQSRI